jgi:hypothetical protein
MDPGDLKKLYATLMGMGQKSRIVMTTPSSFQTFLLQPFQPYDLDAGIFQLLGALAIDKVIRFSNTDETTADLGGDETICTRW